MPGTSAGAKRAVVTTKEIHGDDFYRVIGKTGGERSRGGGFAAKIPCTCEEVRGTHHKAQCAGKRGGYRSKRRSKKAKA